MLIFAKEFYIFKLLPSDYFITKLPLPNNIEHIRTKTQFTYPITEDTLAKAFFEEASQQYCIRLSLPDYIMQANPTDKSNLSSNHQEITGLNITLPVTTAQQLTQTVKTLRQHFYFKQLPASWISITNSSAQATSPTNNTDTNDLTQTNQPLPPLPDNIQLINTLLSQQKILLTLPIILQADITPTMQLLRQYYTIRTIPSFLLNLPPLPSPTWEIFNTPTVPITEPPTTNSAAMDTS